MAEREGSAKVVMKGTYWGEEMFGLEGIELENIGEIGDSRVIVRVLSDLITSPVVRDPGNARFDAEGNEIEPILVFNSSDIDFYV